MKRIKSQMLRNELNGFEFTEEMSRQVLDKIEKKEERKRNIMKPLLPIAVTAAFVVISSAGVYRLAIQEQPNSQSEAPPSTPPADNEEEKPDLLFPGYVPEGYKFKETKTGDDVYEHVYVKENTDDSFSYRMQRKPELFQQDKVKTVRLSPDLQGATFTFISGQSLAWKYDGYFHILEQKGEMSEIDFLKIADSILVKQGIESYLGDEIEKLEAEAKEEERRDESSDVITQTDKEETDKENPMDEVPALTEEEALEILRRYEVINDQVYTASSDLKMEGFKTKDQFYDAFSEVMTRKVAEGTYSYRITEKEDGLYIIPMEDIPSWDFNAPNKFEKINEKRYTITQFRADDLRGHKDYSMSFEYMNGKWLITNYGDSEKKHQADEVPALTEEQALDIIKKFDTIETNIYRVSDNLKFDWFKTKDQFYGAFNNVMTKEETERKFKDRISEKEDGLYIIPMDGFQKWVFQVPHEFTQINEKKYTLSQYLEDDLHGNGLFPVTFEYMHGQWLITKYGKDD